MIMTALSHAHDYNFNISRTYGLLELHINNPLLNKGQKVQLYLNEAFL